MEPKNRKLRFVATVLIILLVISVAALTGTLLYNYLSKAETGTVDVPGNVIKPGEGSSADTGEDDPATDPSDLTPAESSSESLTVDRALPEVVGALATREMKADAISLHTGKADLISGPSAALSAISTDEWGAVAGVKPSELSVPGVLIADQTQPQTDESSSTSQTKASAVSLHTKQPEENKSFEVTNMFPGDSETTYFRVKISYKGDVIVRYHADIQPQYEKLAEVMKVKVRLVDSDRVLYDGLMRDMPKSLECPLYTTKSTQSELCYEITAYLDTSVGNEYQNKQLVADFRWWVEETENLDPPKTGDTTGIYIGLGLVSGALVVLFLLLGKRRKESSDEYQ